MNTPIEKACKIVCNAQWAIYGNMRQLSKAEVKAVRKLSSVMHYLATQGKLQPGTRSV